MVREAKDSWFQQKADTAQARRFSGKLVWKCIRDIQRGRRGLVPLMTTNVVDKEGNMCTTSQ